MVELLAHLVQTHSVVSDEEWHAARDAIRAKVRPDDLVAVAPYWADPIARQMWKDEILSIAREARPDATRFPRAIEVSMRGQHLDEIAGWKVESTEKVGPFTLTVYDNPSYTPLKDDLVNHAAPGKMEVSVVAGGTAAECQFTRGRVETGGLGFGPAIPADRVSCPGGGTLAATVMQPADYRPHRCLFAPPLGGGKTMRVRFLGVAFGNVLHGHAGIDWDSTAHVDEPPVTLVWKVADRTIGRIVAGNHNGWKGFDFDTRNLAGQEGEIVAESRRPALATVSTASRPTRADGSPGTPVHPTGAKPRRTRPSSSKIPTATSAPARSSHAEAAPRGKSPSKCPGARRLPKRASLTPSSLNVTHGSARLAATASGTIRLSSTSRAHGNETASPTVKPPEAMRRRATRCPTVPRRRERSRPSERT